MTKLSVQFVKEVGLAGLRGGLPLALGTGGLFVVKQVAMPQAEGPHARGGTPGRLIIRVGGKERHFSLDRNFEVTVPSDYMVKFVNSVSGVQVLEVLRKDGAAVFTGQEGAEAPAPAEPVPARPAPTPGGKPDPTPPPVPVTVKIVAELDTRLQNKEIIRLNLGSRQVNLQLDRKNPRAEVTVKLPRAGTYRFVAHTTAVVGESDHWTFNCRGKGSGTLDIDATTRELTFSRDLRGRLTAYPVDLRPSR